METITDSASRWAIAEDAAQAGFEPTSRTESESDVWKLGRFLVIMAVLLSIASLPFSSFFEAREVRVAGTVEIPPEEIEALAAVPRGVSIFQIDREAILERVRGHPRVRKATVLPDPPHALLVRVEERRPFLSMDYRGRRLILDEEGVIIGEGEVPGLTRLQVASLVLPRVVWGEVASAQEVRRAAQVLRSIAPEVRSQIEQVVVIQEQFILETQDGIKLLLGEWRGINRRINRLPQVLQAVRSMGISVESADMRYGETVVLRPLAKER